MTNASAAAALPAAPIPAAIDPAFAIHQAAQRLLPHLERGQRVDAASLRASMEAAFDASDASGAWGWKTAYDACEAASVLFLRKYGKALLRKAGSPAAALPMLARVTGLLPTHTRRSTESEAFQQFSTPIPLGLIAATAAAITPTDHVLEPSAGTGLLSVFAELAGGSLALGELHALMRADKEGGADFVLKIANTATDGRFLNAQNLRGATKAPLLSGSNYIAEMA